MRMHRHGIVFSMSLLALLAPALRAQDSSATPPAGVNATPPAGVAATPPAGVAAMPPVQNDAWKTADTIPGVDLAGLDEQKKAAALEVLREVGCTCKCNLKVAQCRIMDPNCPVSPGLANELVKQVREGKTAAAIKSEQQAAFAKAAELRVAQAQAAQQPQPQPAQLVPAMAEITTKGAPFKGPAKAKVTLVEFSDFQCPYCAGASKWAEEILAAFPKDVKLVFKQYPLDIHKSAKMAAEAALAAHAQGKFWQLHDKMFANGMQLTRENIIGWAAEVGADKAKITKALDDGTFRKAVEDEFAEGNRVGVRGTPTFFVNGKRYEGPRTVEAIKPLIAAELEAKPAKSKS